jgi:hypothetical protein
MSHAACRHSHHQATYISYSKQSRISKGWFPHSYTGISMLTPRPVTNADGSSGSESEHSEGQDAGRAKHQPASKMVKVCQIKNHLLMPPLIGCP